MKRLGISIYMEKVDLETNLEYIEKAGKKGFKRVFTCMMSAQGTKEEVLANLQKITAKAHEYNMEVFMDVGPSILAKYGINMGGSLISLFTGRKNDLQFFVDAGLDGIRIDQSSTGMEEAFLTHNSDKLKIEINMSMDTHFLDLVMDFLPNKDYLYGCHNFYPRGYSGLDWDHFDKTTRAFDKYGLRKAAFINSQQPDAFGPWPANDGLPTLEIHRRLPLDVQAKHMIAYGLIDDIMISNCFPSDEELETVAALDLETLALDVVPVEGAPDYAASVMFRNMHIFRGDATNKGYAIRSMTRFLYAKADIPAFNTVDIKRGDIIVDNNDYGQYKGEMQIALKDMKNDGRTNVIGRIREEEIFILDYIKPWQKFTLRPIK